MTFSNDDIVDQRTRLLAHTKSEQTPMAGRASERVWLQSVLLDPQLRVARLWAPLGSGKTTLLDSALRRTDDLDLDENIDVNKSTVTRLDANSFRFEPRLGRSRTVLAVEEFDRKLGFDTMVAAARAACEWLDTTSEPAPLLLLTGDQFLMHPVFDELIGKRPATFGTLEPLDIALLADALALRVDKIFGRAVRDPTDEALAIADQILADSDLRLGLVPPTDPKAATFRDSLATLSELAKRGLPPRSDRIEVPPPVEHGDRSLRGLPRELLDALLDQLRQVERYPAMTLPELAALARAEGGAGHSDEYEDLEYFLDEAVRPLTTAGFLAAHGIAYLPFSGEPVGPNVQGPFTPTPRTYRLHVTRQRA